MSACARVYVYICMYIYIYIYLCLFVCVCVFLVYACFVLLVCASVRRSRSFGLVWFGNWWGLLILSGCVCIGHVLPWIESACVCVGVCICNMLLSPSCFRRLCPSVSVFGWLWRAWASWALTSCCVAMACLLFYRGTEARECTQGALLSLLAVLPSPCWVTMHARLCPCSFFVLSRAEYYTTTSNGQRPQPASSRRQWASRRTTALGCAARPSLTRK